MKNKAEILGMIAQALQCRIDDITELEVLKRGMTNRSFFFLWKNKKYLIRIPGEGTDFLINRKQEAEVYQVIRGRKLCDEPIYLNPENGYKITAFLEDVRVCNVDDMDDVRMCMRKLRKFHEMNLHVNHTFDIFEKIDFYENLWNGKKSVYTDYCETKRNVYQLKAFIDRQEKKWCLTHMDAVSDNFLFSKDVNGAESLQLTDWEYAGMQDPHVDIAMFAIYAFYDKTLTDMLIRLYFNNGCSDSVRIKIYCYIAVCGLLWSNWCEYKKMFGIEFGKYGIRQYQYAKDFYQYAVAEMERLKDEERT